MHIACIEFFGAIIHIGGDSATVSNWWNHSDTSEHDHSPLLANIIQWMSDIPSGKVSRTLHEGNRATNHGAALALKGDYNLFQYDPLPPQLKIILLADCWGVTYVRQY